MNTQCDWCGKDAAIEITLELLGSYDFCTDCAKSINESEAA